MLISIKALLEILHEEVAVAESCPGRAIFTVELCQLEIVFDGL
jgi:hypothetical protein